MKEHAYDVAIRWIGNTGKGTQNYTSYSRDHEIRIGNKPVISASSDPAFRGNPERHNPEELLVASISSCHMLWYLHLCAEHGIIVVSYEDQAKGIMEESKENGGRFIAVTLHPEVEVSTPEMIEKATALHAEAHRLCFIANSLNFPVKHDPIIRVK